MWKAGQLVQLHGKTYRVCKNKTSIGCYECAFNEGSLRLYTQPCTDCCDHELIPYECHFEELQIKCGNQDNS